MGKSTLRIPRTSFSTSLAIAPNLLFAAVLRKSLISKTLADATEIVVRQGMRMLENEVRGLTNDSPIKANGTRTYVAVDTRVLEMTILRALIGRVLVYSSPFPSAVSKASGMSRAKIAPIEVASSSIAVLSVDRFEISKAIITVSRTGRVKKKAVAGFLEATFMSLRT